MNVLDELREAVAIAHLSDRSFSTKTIDELFDAFEAAHPLLHECSEPIECHKCRGEFPYCSFDDDWGEKEIMLRNSDGEIDDHEFVPICPDCAEVTP